MSKQNWQSFTFRADLLTENTNHRRYMEWKLSLLKAVTFVSFLTSCFHLCLSAYSVLQEVLCKYSRWGVGGEQALHLWTAESEQDVRRRHSRLFKKKKRRKKNKQKNVNLQQKRPQRAASLSDLWPCKHSITRFLFHSFCNNHKEIKGVLYIHFLTAASRKSRLFIFFGLHEPAARVNSVLRGEPGASSAVKVHF